jgi:uncharacterized membrane protein YoaK (UPF0700 family)
MANVEWFSPEAEDQIGNSSSVDHVGNDMTVATIDRQWMHMQNCSWPIVFIVCVIALGSGMVRTNTARFGVEHQVEFQAFALLILVLPSARYGTEHSTPS